MSDDDRLTAPERRSEDQDAALRPKNLAEFVGQEAARENLRVFIEAARGRCLNDAGWRHLGITPPSGSQTGLFDAGELGGK